MIKKNYKTITSDTIILLMGNVLAKMVQFFLLPMFTTFMTTKDYGDGELVNNLTEFLLPFVTICIYDATFRFAVDGNCKRILNNAIVVLLKSFIICGFASFLLYSVFKHEYTFLIYLLTFAYGLKMVFSYYVRGKGKNIVFSFSGVVNAISMIVFSWLFLVVFKYQGKGYLFSILVSYFLTSIYLFWAGKIYLDLKNFSVDRIESISMIKYSMPLIFYNLGYWLTNMAGRFLIAYFLGKASAGIYMAAMKIATLMNMIQQAFFMAFQLNAVRELESSYKKQYYYEILELFTIFVSIAGGALLLMNGVIASLMLKNEFAIAKEFLPLIICSAIVDCYFSYYKAIYTVYKKTSKLIPSVMLGAIVNIVAGGIFIPKIGIVGACLASLVCFLAQGIYRLYDTRRFADLKIDYSMAIVCFGCIGLQATLILLHQEFLGGVVYFGLLICLVMCNRKRMVSLFIK